MEFTRHFLFSAAGPSSPPSSSEDSNLATGIPLVNERPPTPSTSAPDTSLKQASSYVRWEQGYYFSLKLLFPEIHNCASRENERPSNQGRWFRYRPEEKVVRHLKA